VGVGGTEVTTTYVVGFVLPSLLHFLCSKVLLPLGLIGNVSGEERQEGHQQQQMSPQSAIDRWATKKQGYIEIRKRDGGGGGGGPEN
jgi:hypothetical protein